MKSTLERIEWKLDQLLATVQRLNLDAAEKRAPEKSEPKMSPKDAASMLASFTVKQHAALQMVLGGCTNREIAERFGVTENTAKVYLRTIARRLGVHSRTQIVLEIMDAWSAVDDDAYKLVSGGLPKNWHDEYVVGGEDEYAPLYMKRGEEDVEAETEAG